MELGGREILIALGALLIVAILLDGFRRVRNAGKGKLRVKRRRQPIFEGDDLDEFGSELPGGGARVVAFRDEDSAEQFSQTIKANREYDPNRVTSPFRQSEPDSVESIDDSSTVDELPEANEGHDERAIGLGDPIAVESASQLASIAQVDKPVATETRDESQTSLLNEEAKAFAEDGDAPESPVVAVADVSTAGSKSKSAKKKFRKSRAAKDKLNKGLAGKSKAAQVVSPSKAPADDDVIILHLMAEQGGVFRGDELLKALINNGLRYGSLKIFHRHERSDGSGAVLFSMANSVNPGTFELNAMGEFLTPGVTFMMVLADSEDPLRTFDLMLACIHGVNSAIGGELKDQQRSALSQQTAEHYRQRIMDFNRRRLTASA